MQIRKKQLVLAYPAFSMPTSPPLGVCSLKGFVERMLSDWSVKVLDLNLASFDTLFGHLARRPCLSGEQFPEGLLGEVALARAAETFRGQHNDEFYSRGDRYTLYANLWLRLVGAELASSYRLEPTYYQNAPLPPFIDELAERILQEQPTAVGLSVCYSQQVWIAFCLARSLKRRTKVPIVMGGTFFNSDAALSWAVQQRDVDCVVSGEGEKPLVQLLAADMNPTGVPGLTYLRSGQIVTNPPAVEEDLDLLGQPDFSDLDLRAYYSPLPVVPMATSRGCYWRRCAFCVHYRSAGQSYRRCSVPHVVEQMKRHVENGIEHFALMDEMISPAHFSQLAEAILAAGLRVAYYAMAKPVKQFDRNLLRRMRQSGCCYLLWGVESGSQRILDLMDKGTRVAEIDEVLETAHAVGLRNHVYIMAGFPTETRAEFQATLNLLERHRPAIAAVHRGPFVLERGSPVAEHPEKFQITRCWPAGELPLCGWLHYECAAGMNRQEAAQALGEALPSLRSFNSFSTHLGNFRDHALLIYHHFNGQKTRE
jgi:hypothetical protein